VQQMHACYELLTSLSRLGCFDGGIGFLLKSCRRVFISLRYLKHFLDGTYKCRPTFLCVNIAYERAEELLKTGLKPPVWRSSQKMS
jgi:hypothetical protein